jgi:hypothetical protein
VVGRYGCKEVEKVAGRHEESHRVLGVPFIGQEMERRGWETGGQAAASGASITHQLHEEEAMGQRQFKEEMKRRQRRTDSATHARWRVAHGRIRCGDATGGRW